MPTERVVGALFHRPEILADAGPEQEEPSATEELLELLAWACDHKVISPADRYLLLCLVEEADRVETRKAGARVRRPAQQRGVQPGRAPHRGL